MKRQTVLDLFLLAGFLTLLSFTQLPRIVHEIVGVLMAVGILVHLFYAKGWIRGLTRGKWDARRALSAAVNVLLAGNILILLGTGIIASNYIFTDLVPLDLHRSPTFRQLHNALGWSMPLLVGLHIGLHAAALWQRFTRQFGIPRAARRTRALCGGLAVLTVAAGIYGTVLNRVADRLRFEHIFATEASALPGTLFVLLAGAMIGMYALLGAGLAALVQKRTS